MKTKSTTRGFAILSAAGMISKLLSLLYVPILLRILGGDKGFGIYMAAYTVFTFIYIITNSGIPSAISKLVSELIAVGNYKDAVKTFKIARFLLLIIGTVMACCLLIFAGALAKAVHFPKAALAIASLAPTVFFTSIASAYRGYFQGRGSMKPTAVSQVLEQLVNIIFSLLFAALLLRYGLEAAVAGGTVGTSLGALVSALYLSIFYEKNKVIKVPKGATEKEVIRYSNRQLVKKIAYYGIPITMSWGLQYAGNIVDMTNTQNRLIVAGFDEDTSNTKYGELSKYQTLINVPITIVSALCAAILPMISSAAALNNKKDVREGIRYSFKISFLIALPAAVGLAVLSKPIFNMLFPGYLGGIVLLEIGSVVLVLMSIVQIQVTILQSIGKLYLATIYTIIGIVAKIFINYILIAIPSINIKGAIYGSMVGYAIPIILNDLLIKRTLKIRYNMLASAVKPFMASAIMGVTAFIVQYSLNFIFGFIKWGHLLGYISNAASTIFAIAVGAFIYLYGLILTGGITKQDLDSVPSRVAKLIPKGMLALLK